VIEIKVKDVNWLLDHAGAQTLKPVGTTPVASESTGFVQGRVRLVVGRQIKSDQSSAFFFDLSPVMSSSKARTSLA
jgi:hypothetical protein